MSILPVSADQCGLPKFRIPTTSQDPGPHLFDFSSHRRAAHALKFGLDMRDPGFNIFVLGEDRSGRMTGTLQFLRTEMTTRPPARDWVYLNNFLRPNKPRPYALPAGRGRVLKERLETAIGQLRDGFETVFNGPECRDEGQAKTESDRAEIKALFDTLRDAAQARGLDVQQNEKGVVIVALAADGTPVGLDELPPERRAAAESDFDVIAEMARETLIKSQEYEDRVAKVVGEIRRRAAQAVLGPQIDRLKADFTAPGLGRWVDALAADILDHLDLFEEQEDPQSPHAGGHEGPEGRDSPEDRYAVNLLVDHGDDPHPEVVLEPNPTYENLFGAIQYRPQAGGYGTHFSQIKPGALHRANGGVLVLRAESLVEHEEAWVFLKAALRDGEIRIEEQHKNGPPIAGAPDPQPIPLDVKLVIVGAPRFYYTFFSLDAEFRNHFRVKADIDADMPADGANIRTYAGLLRAASLARTGLVCDRGALSRLLAQAARWAEDRTKLTARYEQVVDALIEAGALAKRDGAKTLTARHVRRAIEERRHRNSRMEDHTHERIQRRELLIDSHGEVVGQVNAMTVVDHGDHLFGVPARITAQAYAGTYGVINIERDAALSGPLQQKAVMEIEGYLKAKLAQSFPPSFACSLTFEQNYGGIEGDSASVAELCAILSALAGVPLRQDIGVTGSMNQLGDVQAVGGVTHKVEGFYRVCADQGFTGKQGVVIPSANLETLLARDEVARAIAAGMFHVWAVDTVAEAIELLTGLPSGESSGPDYRPGSVFGRALARLQSYDRALAARRAHGAGMLA